MKMINQDNNLLQTEEEEYFDLKTFFYKILARWWWFAISIPLCALIALYICFSSTPVYKVGAKVMISDSKKGEVGVNPMLKELGLFQGTMMVENEIVELKSKNLILDVVKELELNVDYTREKVLREEKLYKDSPFRMLVDLPENIKDTTFYVIAKGADKIEVLDADKNVMFEGNFSQAISMGDYRMTVEKNDSLLQVGDEIRVDLLTYGKAATDFHKRLEISLLEKNASAVGVSLKETNPGKGVDFLYTMIRRYNQNGIEDKQLVSEKTVEFINERLRVINQELGDIENSAETFKKTNQLTNLTSDAALAMEQKKATDAELLKLGTEMDVVKSVRAYLEDRRGEEFRILPEQLGLTDESLNSGISKYNEMILRRGKLLQSARESNPIVLGLEAQLRDLKSSIRSAIANVENGLDIKIKSLERESQQVEDKLTSVPTQEKQYRSIAREQELKENLFLFLMQKREEAEIAKLMYVPMAKIIENPDPGEHPVAPRKMLILLFGMFMGVVLPVGIMFVADMLDTKVRNADEVGKVVNAPLLGTLPQLPEEKTSIESEDWMMSESMQLIRENLNYLIKRKDTPVIMVSSTIPSEGKSLVAAHLASAYARAGKKVIVIGCDLRNPRLNEYFKREGRKGLSAYLAGMVDDPGMLVEKVNDNLHVIFGGTVPPNPTQLIASPRMGELLACLKSEFSCIILDTPPLGILADGFSLSEYADACVYVVRANVLDKKGLRVVADLEKGGRLANLGIVVNGIKVSRSGGYGYGYGYGQDGKDKKKKK